MERTRLHTLTDWRGGILDSTILNTLLYSYPLNFAALIPVAPPGVTTQYSGVQLFNGNGGATKNGGSAWASLPSAGGPAFPNQIGAMVTTQTGDTLTIPVPAGIESVLIVLAGVVPGNVYRSGDPVAQAAAIRDGCKANITVDGSLLTTVDTNNVVVSTPGLIIFSGVGTHTIIITHTGTQDPGVNTPSMLAVVEVLLSTGGVVAGGTYTSPVMDSGDPRTQWFMSAWRETPLPAGFTSPATTSLVDTVQVMVGNTLVNPLTQPYRNNLLDATASGGIAGGTLYECSSPQAADLKTSQANPRFGCSAPPQEAVGQYAQFIITFALTSITNPYLVDFDVYSWVAAWGEDEFTANLFLPPSDRIGPNYLSYLGCLGKLVVDKYNDAIDLNNSYAIATAATQYLPIIGADRGLVIYSGEDPDAFRIRVLAATQSYANGGSASNICEIISILVNGTFQTPVITTSSGRTVATAGGVVVQGTAAYAYSITIPPAPYPNLTSVSLALARTIISDLAGRLNPVGLSPSLTFL